MRKIIRNSGTAKTEKSGGICSCFNEIGTADALAFRTNQLFQ